ncbi:MAG TPA: RluA family pseudouridine synthase [Candidatus Levybacteria bacterium]|nr:RluA family pseudouridine synthase [Candidatus Levybacteria bacterium]
MIKQPPSIIFENDFLFVINKPYGMVVNKADTTKDMYTVQDWVEAEFTTFGHTFTGDKDSDFYKRAGIVHRIDKETSGALIIAKNEETFFALQKQFKEKTVHKKYVALCHGHIRPEEGVIDVPVGRLPWNRRKFGVVADGRESRTKYALDRTYNAPNKEVLSLVNCFPETGRTHQIRVHMRYIGFPIFGDPLYAGRKNSKRDRKLLERHFLHAQEVSFINPSDKERISVVAPFPPELVDFLATLT